MWRGLFPLGAPGGSIRPGPRGRTTLDSGEGMTHIPRVGRLVNVILLGLVLGGLVIGALALGNAVRRTGNEGARDSSSEPTQTVTRTQTVPSASRGSEGHSTRRLKVLTAEVVGGVVVAYVILSAIGALRRSRRRERWHA
jgi:hypothetical protein